MYISIIYCIDYNNIIIQSKFLHSVVKMEEPVKVYIRLRPPLEFETKGKILERCVQISDSGIVKLTYPHETTRGFQYDGVFPDTSNEADIFNYTGKPLLESVLEGYNGTLFVYGQTGTGKTHTMGLLKKVTPKAEGIVPRTLKELFENSANINVYMSFLQIYMENIYDLLNHTKKSLKLREGNSGEVFIQDLIQVPITDFEQASTLINAGLANRVTGAQNVNQTSSRSHIVLMLNIESTIPSRPFASKLTLIDLAGSERVRSTSSSGLRLQQAKFINASLSALGKVICALTNGNNSHVPYRDSKLTRLLQSSLNGKVVLIATIGPAYEFGGETLSTLQFASRCKEVVTVPILDVFNPEETNQSIPSHFEETLEALKRKEEFLQARIKELEEQPSPIFAHNQNEVILYLLKLISKLAHTSSQYTKQVYECWNLKYHDSDTSQSSKLAYLFRDFEAFEEGTECLDINLQTVPSSNVIENVQNTARRLMNNLNILGKCAVESQRNSLLESTTGTPSDLRREDTDFEHVAYTEPSRALSDSKSSLFKDISMILRNEEGTSKRPQTPDRSASLKELLRKRRKTNIKTEESAEVKDSVQDTEISEAFTDSTKEMALDYGRVPNEFIQTQVMSYTDNSHMPPIMHHKILYKSGEHSPSFDDLHSSETDRSIPTEPAKKSPKKTERPVEKADQSKRSSKSPIPLRSKPPEQSKNPTFIRRKTPVRSKTPDKGPIMVKPQPPFKDEFILSLERELEEIKNGDLDQRLRRASELLNQ